ncbi:cysteine--tRNA ligase [Spirochaeta dissipatitropha]
MSLQPRFPLHIYNSRTRSREEFTPLHDDHVGMYVCGPTVYGDTHLGNARPAITFDVIFRFFTLYGYKVRYIRNITDVGHLEDEQRESGEDKIAKKARIAKLEPMEIAQTYTNQYRSLLSRMSVLPPSIEPTASGHIIEQQDIIQRIIDAGYAYESHGSIYFDLHKFAKDHPYGGLSGKNMEELLSGTRNTQGLQEKKSPLDFALWKSADTAHIMRWKSPWGIGFPGWHLECTAMSTKYLGESFDIHGGGLDLQFPHHEAEIAQNRAAFGSDPARFWIHNNMLTIDGQKMSKSLGNFVTLHELYSGTHKLFPRRFSPVSIRFFMLQAHYRSPIDLSADALQAAEKGLHRLAEGNRLVAEICGERALEKLCPGDNYGFISLSSSGKLEFELDEQLHAAVWDSVLNAESEDTAAEKNATPESSRKHIILRIARFYKHMAEDFNTAKAIADLFELVHMAGRISAGQIPAPDQECLRLLYESFTVFYLGVLGLGGEQNTENDRVEQLVSILIDFRNQARADKDWAAADKIRDTLKDLGITILDSKEGTSFRL